MISVGIVSAAGIGYYLDTVGSGVDDYYVRTAPGWWAGAGAAGIGLYGEVAPAAIEALAAGAHPVTGEPLGAGRRGNVAAYDLTFSAPKSVSVLAEVAADPAIRALVLDAHHTAVVETIGLLEAEAVRGRRGHAGAVTVRTAGLIAAGFDHHTSRAGDPQLHTHLLVANRALGVDGRWGALDGRRLYGWAKTAGYAYQASLRHQLTVRLGVEWGPTVNGIADLVAIPEPVLVEFSTRRAQIVAALHDYGAASPRAAQIATLATRPPKPGPVDPDVQRHAWQDRARHAGLDPDALTPLSLSAAGVRAPGLRDPARLATTLAAPTGLTARRSSFDRRAVLEAVAAVAHDGATVAEVIRTAKAVVRDDRFVATGKAGHLAGPTWTTVELAATETRLLATIDRRRHSGLAVCDPRTVTAALAERTLSDEQTGMVTALTRSGHGVEVVVGPAGTGKTTALDAARTAWADSGIDVIGAALAARTARALEAGTAIPSGTVDQILNDLARPGPTAIGVLPADGVLVVDEAGMVGTRKLDRLLHAAEVSRTKVVLVGDPRQLPEIEAGGAFAALAQRHAPIALSINRRQTHEWERAALHHIREGRPGPAVVAYRQHGRITLTATAEEARDRLVADWAAARHPGGTVMVALTRDDVDDLNGRAIHQLETDRVLDPDRQRLHVGDRTYGTGERVMALRNDRRAGIVNGTTATITTIHPADRTITIQPDAPGAQPVTLTADYLAAGHLTHGWAITAHKAQGITTGQAFLLGTDRLYREAGYVALSRATERTDWYQPNPTPPAWAPTVDPGADLNRLLQRSAAQHLATTPADPNSGPAQADATRTDGMRADGMRADGMRADGMRAAVLADPGEHHTTALGPPPLTRHRRDLWAATALTIDDYRHRHHIHGTDPLGPEPPYRHSRHAATPDQTDRYREWLAARIAIDETRRNLGRHLEPDRGLTL